MNNTYLIKQVTSSFFNSSVFPQVLNKLSGDNITTIILSVIAAGTICYIGSNGGNLELSVGDKKVVLNGSEKVA